ncbi:hypothetical protein M431DRAFT_479895 [Trichoderma harzianum CBS 226.95]|uniref:Uncharacterized protein n=1 Tax=Trichoderma harzianum CBS 226.95 TaxID=983964 RepID=A0A2T4AMW6_TRIHA|nr:hypothetical protein M431DRAFT_479895 [Trichoderma harzianum CBS 226.95]PTB58413.1 hypothetical protein M431DRAFT_479895 [Trichoderma harzianum CBS 226.95]
MAASSNAMCSIFEVIVSPASGDLAPDASVVVLIGGDTSGCRGGKGTSVVGVGLVGYNASKGSRIVSSRRYRFQLKVPIRFWLLPGHRAVNPAWALVWTHTGDDGKEVNESIVTSIHGSQVDEKHLNAFLESEPLTEKLALMHGLKESGLIGVQIAFGAKSGLALYRRIQPKYWLANHDALFTYNGLLYKSVQLNDVGRTVDWALEQEQKVSGVYSKAMKPNFIKAANGECFVLV